MAHSQATQEQEPDLFFMWAKVLFTFAAFIFAIPALVVAIPLGLIIEERAWPRWPILLVGAGATVVGVAAGGWHLYLYTWLDIVRHLRIRRTPDLAHLFGLAPLGVTAGIAGGAVVQFFLYHRGDTEAARHRRDEHSKRRYRIRSARAVHKTKWPEPKDRIVLGLRLDGDVSRWTITKGMRMVVAPPLDVWKRQSLILGETGSGKTVTALALAAEALRLGWDVFFIDGKADLDIAGAFLAAARAQGVDAKDGFAESIDGWRGGPDAVVNRLLATQEFTEPYYEGIARTVLRAAVGDDPPSSLAELLRRMDRRSLVRLAERDGYLLDVLKQIPERELFGTRARYEGIAWAVGDALDGSWSYEDVKAAYIPVGRRENRTQAQEIGAFVLEDLLHWAMARKRREQSALVIVDEFSKLSFRPGAAVELIERARACGVAVALIGQTWASIGADETVRSRLAGTVGTVIVHQLKQANDVATLAGTEWTLERTEQILTDDLTGLGSQRVGNRYVVHPDEVRRLGTGEAFLIHGGNMLRLRIRPVRRQ